MDIRNILFIGASCVGKTSLAATVIGSACSFLDSCSGGRGGIELTLEPDTAARVEALVRALKDGVRGGRFDAAAVAATSAPERFDITVGQRRRGLISRFMGPRAGFGLRFHDYPGALIGDLPAMTRGVMPLSTADAVIVPIDAALLMEASCPDEEVAAQALHQMARVEELVIEWVKGRSRSESGLIMLVPVKCESYFSKPDDWNRLGRLVCHTYFSQVLSIVGVFGANITCVYAPVDTVGCCRVAARRWVTGQAPSFSADYSVSDGDSFAPLGGEVVMLILLEYFLRLAANTTTGEGQLEGIGTSTAAEMVDELGRLQDYCRDELGYKRAVHLC